MGREINSLYPTVVANIKCHLFSFRRWCPDLFNGLITVHNISDIKYSRELNQYKDAILPVKNHFVGIRRSYYRLIPTLGFSIPARRHLYINSRSRGCFTNVSRALQNILLKFVCCRNHTSYQNFKLKLCACAKSHALGTRTQIQLGNSHNKHDFWQCIFLRTYFGESISTYCDTPLSRKWNIFHVPD